MKKLKQSKYVTFNYFKGPYDKHLTKTPVIVEIEYINKNIYKCKSSYLKIKTPDSLEFLSRGQISERIRCGIYKPIDEAGIAILLLSD